MSTRARISREIDETIFGGASAEQASSMASGPETTAIVPMQPIPEIPHHEEYAAEEQSMFEADLDAFLAELLGGPLPARALT